MLVQKSIGIRRAMLLSSAAAVILASGGIAWGQDTETDQQAEPAAQTEKITVTGSRIKRSNFTSETPVTVVSGEAVRESGAISLGQVLQQQMAAGSIGFTQSNVLNGSGASSLDLRNLGGDRVLVLINGKRIANFADSLQNEAIDLNFVPLAMIERVDILRDGASSTYGADAVSGVVNIILRDDYEGIELSVQQGVSTYGDAETTQLQAVVGLDHDRGNTVISAEYRFADDVPQREREWAIPTITALNPGSFGNGSVFHPGGLFLGDIAALECTVPRALGGDEQTLAPFGTCLNLLVGTSTDPNEIVKYDYAFQQAILNELKALSISSYTTYDINNAVTAFAEIEYSKRESMSYLDGNPSGTGTPTIPNGWRVPATNPNNPTGEDGLFLIRPTTTIGIRRAFVDSDLIRFVSGIKGDTLFDDFEWELAYLYTQVNTRERREGLYNLLRANIISDPALCAADLICSTVVNPSGALDTFRPANWTDAEIAYLRQIGNLSSEFSTDGVFGNIVGDLVELPAGAAGVAVGFEYREDKGQFKPDSVTEAGESVENQVFSTSGKFEAYEFFGELNIPVFADLEFAQDLSINLQARWLDYSTFGEDTVWKAGLNWQIVDAIRFRANYGTSFRAPSIVDVFGGGVVSFDGIIDPCNNWDTSGDPNIIANCGPAGANLPVGWVNPINQFGVLAGGDLVDGIQDLGPETANTYTMGFVFTPDWVGTLSASIEYWRIDITDFITREDTQELVDNCYNGGAGLSDPDCARFTRQGGFPFSFIGLTTGLTNLGEGWTAGYDWGFVWSFEDVFGGTLTFDHQGTYLHQYQFGTGAGTVFNPNTNNLSVPRVKMVLNTEYAPDFDWGISWRVRFIGEVDDVCPTCDGNNLLGHDKVPEQIEHDLRVRWEPSDEWAFLAGVNNVFNEDPPYIFDTGTNTDAATYNSAVVGRYFFFRVTARQ
jgi:iron complex outermembrane recepter protein